MAEITETHIERENEQAKVESWRLHVLIEAGFPLPLAERLAASEADLHTCVDLLRQGCAPRDRRRDPPLERAALGAQPARDGRSTLPG